MELEPFLTPEVRHSILLHMVEFEPLEVCGVITLSNGLYTYVPKMNVADDPQVEFAFDKKTSREVMKDNSIVAYAHTHPNGPTIPTEFDMHMQMAVAKPSVIGYRDPDTGEVGVFSFGDHMLDYPIKNRPWRYGVFDCLETLRSYKWQVQGIKWKQYPRFDNWWLVGERDAALLAENPNMYVRYFPECNLVEFEPNFKDPSDKLHPKEGDVILMQCGAPVINHAGIYVGNDLVLHHRVGKRSGETPLGYMMNQHYVRKWLREPQGL